LQSFDLGKEISDKSTTKSITTGLGNLTVDDDRKRSRPSNPKESPAKKMDDGQAKRLGDGASCSGLNGRGRGFGGSRGGGGGGGGFGGRGGGSGGRLSA